MTRREFRIIAGQSTGSPERQATSRRRATRREFKTIHCGVFAASPDSAFPVNLRAFGSSSGSMLWEVRNFAAIARSPDNTLWGWSVRKVTPSGYSRRVISQVVITSVGTQPAGSGWVAKTNPSGWADGVRTIAIDLTKVSPAGVKTTLVSDWLVYTGTSSATAGDLFSDKPVPTRGNAPEPALYKANNSGRVIQYSAASVSFPAFPEPSSSVAEIVIQDGPITADSLSFTIRAQPLFKHASAGSNAPKWKFKRAGTTVDFPLYGTASEVITALESLPGVASVTATGGPCCSVNMHITVTWDDPSYTFSDAWVTYANAQGSNRIVWNWTNGGPSMFLVQAVESFTSDGTGLLSSVGTDGLFRRRAWAASSTHPWDAQNGTNVWEKTPFKIGANSLSQTNERTKIGAGTTWDAVPRSFTLADVRSGTILLHQTRGRVPVVEPSANAMTTHATVNETTGDTNSLHDAHLNVPLVSRLTENEDLTCWGVQYGYAYQGGDEGVAPPPGSSFDSSLGLFGRCHSGRTFATGSGDLFEPFGLHESPGTQANQAATDDNYYLTVAVGDGDNFDWNFETYGELSSNEYRSAGRYVACRWTEFASGTPDPVLPAHRREAWFTFASVDWPAVPPDLEWRFVHRSGGSNVKTTAWFSVDATEAEVDTELQAWYGEPLTGYPTITISGTVEAHEFQDQPFWQYMPLAHIEIWTDATGAVFAPRGRVLGLEVRNGTAFGRKALVTMNRTTGAIKWQKDVGLADPVYTAGDTVSGNIAFADPDQVVVATLCKPVLQDDLDLGECLWEWDGTDWTLITDGCSEISEAVAPTDPGTTIGQQQAGTCELI
jgi:hypothetical protein